MNTVAMSQHIAQQMGLAAAIEADGRCYITTDTGPHEWDLFGSTPLSVAQRNMGFAAWTQKQGLPSDPQACAIATGYIE